MREAQYVFQTLRNVLPEAGSFCEVAFGIFFFLKKKKKKKKKCLGVQNTILKYFVTLLLMSLTRCSLKRLSDEILAVKKPQCLHDCQKENW